MEQKEIYKVAEVQLSYRPHFRAQDRPQINSSEMVYRVLLENWEFPALAVLLRPFCFLWVDFEVHFQH